MSVPSRFLDPQYINWLRCASSLVTLKESLHDYTEAGVRRLYDNVKHNVTAHLGSHFQCSDCSWKGIRQQHSTGVWSIRCTKSICNVWLGEILSKHDDPHCRTINWGNADITMWSTHPWEIAKIFMTNGQRNKTDLPQELDSPALLSLLKYCKEFHPISVQLVSDEDGHYLANPALPLKVVFPLKVYYDQIIKIRNEVFHSTNQKVSDLDKDTWIDSMLLLVSSLNIQGVTYTNINKLKTEDISVSFQDQEIKVLQNLVSEVLKEVKALKGDIESLKITQIQYREEIDKVKGAAGDNEAKIIGLQTQNQQLETDLKGQKSQLETYTQVISTLKAFIDDNPDLSKIKISEELRAAFSEIRALETQLQTAESQLENIKGELILIRVDQEAMKTEINILKGEQEIMTVEHQEMKGEITGVKGEQHKIRVEHEIVKGEMNAVKSGLEKITVEHQREISAVKSEIMRVEEEKMRNQMENLGLNQREKQTEIQRVQHIQKDLLLCYRFLNVIPISPLHESYTTLLDDIFTSIIIEKGGDFQEEGQSRNSKQPIYLRSYHQLFGDKGIKRLILNGFMGSGKTVFCRKVVQTWCGVKTPQVDPESAGERQVPSTSALDGEDTLSQFEFLFFINLAKVNSQEDLFHAIHRQCSIPNDNENESFLCKLLQEMPEKILIILDGLDEMGSQSPDFVNDLLERKLYPQVTVLVSTRPWQVSKLSLQAHSYYDLLLDVKGFDEKRALEFATKIIHAHDKDIKDHLIKDMVESLKKKEIFATFRSVPLLLLFIINVWYSDRSLPDQYSKLYSKIIDCMTKRYLNKNKDKHRNINWIEMSDSETKTTMEPSVFVQTFGIPFLELTSRLSYQLLRQRQDGRTVIISGEELLEALDKDKKIAESKLGVLLDCGILSKSDASSPLERNYSVSFLHLTIQEFLAAVHLTINKDVFEEFISSWTGLDDVLQNEYLVIFTCGLAPNLGTQLFSHICEVCDKDSKVLEYRHDFSQKEHAIENLCSLYRSCLNEVKAKATLPLSDIRIRGLLTQNESEDFLNMTINLGLTCTIKSINSFCERLSADSCESLCKIISKCTQLQSLGLSVITVCDSILDLSRLTSLTYLNLWYVTMSSECSKSLCRNISNCTHLQYLHLRHLSLHDSILDLSRLTGLTNHSLRYVTMSSECSKSLCTSISNCTHLQTLGLIGISLHDSILELSRLTQLTNLNLWNVTMSSECSKSLCTSITNCTHLQTLHLRCITLDDSILVLSRLTHLTNLNLHVTESIQCKSLCRSISDCTQLQTLHLINISLDDSILDLSRLTGLTNLDLQYVTISSECSKSLCRSISECSRLRTLHLMDILSCSTLHDSILDLSRLKQLTNLNLWNVTMSSECSKSLCRSITNCTHLQTLHLNGISLHDSILDLSRLTGLTILDLRNVTMSNECSKSLSRSISNCTHLQTLHLEHITLHDGILDLSRLTGLTNCNLQYVTISSECSKSLCQSISDCTCVQTLHLRDISLHDSILDVSKLTCLTILDLWNVTMSNECSKSLCRSISNCTHLQTLHLEHITLDDGILDVSRLTGLTNLSLQYVTISSECSQSLCQSISDCTCVQTLHLRDVLLHDSILDVSKLTCLTILDLWNVTMSNECSKSLCRSISNCTHLQTLHLEHITLDDGILDVSRLTGLTNLSLQYVHMSSECHKSLYRSKSNCTRLQNLHLEHNTLHGVILDLDLD